MQPTTPPPSDVSAPDAPEPMGRACEYCRHWVRGATNLGECRRSWPVPNGEKRAVWPLTYSDDYCAYFVLPVGSGTMAKVTDAEILEMVRLRAKKEMPLKRAWLVEDLIDQKGLARTSAMQRVEKLVSHGELIQGLVRPPALKFWNQKHPAIWLPGCPPDGAGEAVIERVPGQVGRPSYRIEAFAPALRAHATEPTTRAGLVRIMRTVVEKIGEGTVDRLIEQAIDTGLLKEANGRYWVTTIAPSAPALPPPSIDVG